MQIESPSTQENLKVRIERARTEFPSLWRDITRQWRSADSDAAWLTYAANYLLFTAGVRWALDPYSLFTRLGEGEQPDFAGDLAPLQLVVLSHAHNDHLDPNLISAIQHLPVTWVIPEFMQEKVAQTVHLPAERIITPRPGNPIHFGDLVLHPFDALHFRQGNGVPEMGYLAEFNGKRWFFPGDTRMYDPNLIPHFDHLDGIFAHLWLGKACALEKEPPLLREFCEFHLSFNPGRIVVTHMGELGRAIEELWDISHFEMVCAEFVKQSPHLPVTAALMGNKVVL